MNERIKELAEQANTLGDWGEDITEGRYFVSANIKNLEKFAQLIVRECIWALWTEECRTSDLASEEYTRGSNKIKEHFGVEK
jgi:hypothetical protein